MISAHRFRASFVPPARFFIGVLAVVLLAVGLAACQSKRGKTGEGDAGDELTAQQEAALADTIASVNRRFVERFTRLDPAAYLRYVGDDIRYYFQGWAVGSAYEQALRDFMAGHRTYAMEIIDSSIEVLGPDAGVATGVYRVQAVDTTGQSREHEAAFTKIYERRNGNWMLVRGHESVVPEQDQP